METLKAINYNEFNLKKSLSPIWKLTYYTGLTSDWCHSNPKQRRLLCNIIPYAIKFVTLIFLLYSTSSSVFQLHKVLINPQSKCFEISQMIMYLSDNVIVLFIWVYFVVYRSDIQAFFSDWGIIIEEEKVMKGVDANKTKRTCVVVYILYVCYSIFYLVYNLYLIAITNNDSPMGDEQEDHLMILIVSYYFPDLVVSRTYHGFWVKFKNTFLNLLFAIFSCLMDIVPTLVYYHAAKIVEGMQWEVRELSNGLTTSVSKCGTAIYSQWSRFEALTVMVKRADDAFGPVIIMSRLIYLQVFSPASSISSKRLWIKKLMMTLFTNCLICLFSNLYVLYSRFHSWESFIARLVSCSRQSLSSLIVDTYIV